MKKKIYVLLTFLVLILGVYFINSENTAHCINTNYDKTDDYEDLIIKRGNENEKVVALTFDDGPDEDYTPQILDILKKHNVKATFFVVGQKVGWNKEIVKRAFEEGHEIANHTFTHINVSKKSYDAIKKEITKTQEIIKDTTGQYPTSFRPPYRAISKNMCSIVKENNMDIILWSNIDPRDWSNPGVWYICDTITTKVENGNIILLHDYNNIRSKTSQTVRALDTVIPKLKEKGYKFVTISDLKENINKERTTQKQQ